MALHPHGDETANRWLGLELGAQRIAVSLRDVRGVLRRPLSQPVLQGSERIALTAEALALQGELPEMFLHEGRPVVVGDWQWLGKRYPGLALREDTFADGAQAESGNWVVVFKAEGDAASVAVRVDRTAGPFRASPQALGVFGGLPAQGVEYLGLAWQVAQRETRS